MFITKTFMFAMNKDKNSSVSGLFSKVFVENPTKTNKKKSGA